MYLWVFGALPAVCSGQSTVCLEKQGGILGKWENQAGSYWEQGQNKCKCLPFKQLKVVGASNSNTI